MTDAGRNQPVGTAGSGLGSGYVALLNAFALARKLTPLITRMVPMQERKDPAQFEGWPPSDHTFSLQVDEGTPMEPPELS